MVTVKIPPRSERGGELATETLAGKDVSVKRLSRTEAEILAAEVQRIIDDQQSPIVAEMIAENFENLLKLVEAVNYNTKQGYLGANSRGAQLIAQLLTPSDLNKTSWDVTIASGSSNFISSFTTPRETPEEEGEIIVGLQDQQLKPLVDKVQFYKDGDNLPQEPVSFRVRKTFAVTSGETETPVYKLRRALIAPPETKYAMRIHATASGSDSLEPIGFRVRRASEVLTTL